MVYIGDLKKGVQAMLCIVKYRLTGAKFIASTLQDRSQQDLIKEITQAKTSVLCDISGRAAGDTQLAA